MLRHHFIPSRCSGIDGWNSLAANGLLVLGALGTLGEKDGPLGMGILAGLEAVPVSLHARNLDSVWFASKAGVPKGYPHDHTAKVVDISARNKVVEVNAGGCAHGCVEKSCGCEDVVMLVSRASTSKESCLGVSACMQCTRIVADQSSLE
jgi:hypothetical protein